MQFLVRLEITYVLRSVAAILAAFANFFIAIEAMPVPDSS